MKPFEREQLKSWLEEIAENFDLAEERRSKELFLRSYRESMYRLFLRIENLEEVHMYRECLDTIIRMKTTLYGENTDVIL